MIPVSILICHSDESDRLRTRTALEEAHLSNTLHFVEDGPQLLDYLYQRGAYAGETGSAPRPGLILMDLKMPDEGGRKALMTIQSDASLHDIPIVGLSMSRVDEETMRGYKLGVNSFISMPVTFSGLVEAMSVLGRYWLQIVELPPVTRAV